MMGNLTITEFVNNESDVKSTQVTLPAFVDDHTTLLVHVEVCDFYDGQLSKYIYSFRTTCHRK
jgi:hypothetical protein